MLVCAVNGKYVKCYQSIEGKKTYIKNKQVELKKKLALKKYLSAKLKNLNSEKTAILEYLKIHNKNPNEVEKLLSNKTYNQVLTPVIQEVEQSHLEWMYSDYPKNELHPENLRHNCMSGHIVRSKSEVLIAQALFAHNIPFRYEELLELNGMNMYPDFKILHPRTEKIIFWEHFGMADVPSYINQVTHKLNIYLSNGYVPNQNLITTYETRNYPLTVDQVEDIIEKYLL